MRDTEIRGVPFEKGEKVVMWYVSANYDEEVFDESVPLRRRPGGAERESTSFGGGGPHYCLGAWLARLELGYSRGDADGSSASS